MPRSGLPTVTDFEDAILIWIQENHEGRDELETIRVLSGFGDAQFDEAVANLTTKGILTVRGADIQVTPVGLRVWERLHGPRYRRSQATNRLRQWIRAGNNCLVVGGNRLERMRTIEMAGLDYVLGNRLHVLKPALGIDRELEKLGQDEIERLVVFRDVHSIPSPLLWKIRSVAQFQRHVTYILEGAQPQSLIRKVLGSDAAFYQQLTLVDLDTGGVA